MKMKRRMKMKTKIYVTNFNTGTTGTTGTTDPDALRECALRKKTFDYEPFIQMSDEGLERLARDLTKRKDIDEMAQEIAEKILAAADKEKAEDEKHKEVAARNLYRRRAGDVPLEHRKKCDEYFSARNRFLHREEIGIVGRCVWLKDTHDCACPSVDGFECMDIYDPCKNKG